MPRALSNGHAREYHGPNYEIVALPAHEWTEVTHEQAQWLQRCYGVQVEGLKPEPVIEPEPVAEVPTVLEPEASPEKKPDPSIEGEKQEVASPESEQTEAGVPVEGNDPAHEQEPTG